MNLQQTIDYLKQEDLSIIIVLPNGISYPAHFHITEIGKIEKTFIDCGGEKRKINSCLLQAWTANDYQHRLKSLKLANIMEMAKNTLSFDNEEIEIELERNGIVAQYILDGLETLENIIYFNLDNKKTDCLAKDKCGITSCDNGNCCC